MSASKKFRIMPFLLVLLPLWLIGSGAYALVKYFKKEKADVIEEQQRFSQSVSSVSIADDLKKIITMIGERNSENPEKLSATASMIQGTLGLGNTGYVVKTFPSPSDAPIIQASIFSKNTEAAPVWVIASYDSPLGSRGAEKNATGLVASLATAQALAESKPARDIHFIYIPHANDPDSPVLETAAKLREIIVKSPAPKAILCIEAMGDTETLMLTSRDTETVPAAEFDGLGEVVGAEVACLGEDFDLASTLSEMDLPAIRIATRPTLLPDEEDDKIPFAPTLAASTGRLIELVKRLAE